MFQRLGAWYGKGALSFYPCFKGITNKLHQRQNKADQKGYRWPTFQTVKKQYCKLQRDRDRERNRQTERETERERVHEN